MSGSFVWNVALLFLFRFVSCAEETSSGGSCELSVSINSRRNEEAGGWETSYSILRESTSSNVSIVVKHRYTERQGKNRIHIHGLIKDFYREWYKELTANAIAFHPKCGTNARVINDGLSVEKINLEEWENSVTFTNRPLKDNERFDVRVDVKNGKFKNAIGIGVTTNSPYTTDIPDHMNNMRKGTWMMYLENVYKDGNLLKANFMKNLKEIKVGERVGVKRTPSGDLHLFINGVDQGVAAKDVPSKVYGVFELYYGPAKATIVEEK